MKHLFLAVWTLFLANSSDTNMKQTIQIKVGTEKFTATLLDNKTTASFVAMLPLTIKMKELNNNEKYGQLTSDLPTQTEDIGTIQEGDLLLWGSNTLVIFYKTFKTSYQYSKIGKIDDPKGLASALGSGNVTVSFELK